MIVGYPQRLSFNVLYTVFNKRTIHSGSDICFWLTTSLPAKHQVKILITVLYKFLT